MKLDLFYEEFFNKPIEVVWKAISDPAALAVWLMNNDFEARIGRKFIFRHDPGSGSDCGRGFVECTVLEIQPLKRLAFSWLSTDDGQPTLVEIEVRSQGISPGCEIFCAGPDRQKFQLAMAGRSPHFDAERVRRLKQRWSGAIEALLGPATERMLDAAAVGPGMHEGLLGTGQPDRGKASA